jgi:hypothetical protein
MILSYSSKGRTGEKVSVNPTAEDVPRRRVCGPGGGFPHPPSSAHALVGPQSADSDSLTTVTGLVPRSPPGAGGL